MEKYLITKFDTHGREPILSKMKDGSLICMFLTGDRKEPRNGNLVEAVRSFDDGKTWTKREALFQHPNRGVWCTDIFNGGEFPLAVIQLYNGETNYRELQTLYAITKDNGKTWSDPVSFSGHINGCSLRQGFTLSNGDYFFPLYWQETTCEFDYFNCDCKYPDWKFRGGAGISNDQGKTWYRYGYFANDIVHYWEPNAVEVEPGHVIMYFRASGAKERTLAFTESFDYGKTWTEIKQSNIPNSDAKFILKKIKNKIFLINNFGVEKWGFEGRTDLEIHVSDDGKNFKKILQLCKPEEAFFYPHAYVDDTTETLYVAYENVKEHYLVKISYKELGL